MDSISVLMIDDNPAFLRVTSEFLDGGGDVHVVGTATKGKDALALVRQHKPQIALVDIAMPDVSGLELVPTLRSEHPNLGIIILTVMSSAGFRQASLRAGANAFIPKARMRTELLPTIRQLAQRPPSAAYSAPEMTTDPQNAQPRILVIEDDPSLGEIYRKAITSADYDVDAADNLATARGYLSTKHYDVVVCDVHIGDDRATHLLREFAETLIGSGSQIMMVSGEPQYQAVCQEIGADLFMVKPVAISTLLSLINRLTAHPMTQRDGQPVSIQTQT